MSKVIIFPDTMFTMHKLVILTPALGAYSDIAYVIITPFTVLIMLLWHGV